MSFLERAESWRTALDEDRKRRPPGAAPGFGEAAQAAAARLGKKTAPRLARSSEVEAVPEPEAPAAPDPCEKLRGAGAHARQQRAADLATYVALALHKLCEVPVPRGAAEAPDRPRELDASLPLGLADHFSRQAWRGGKRLLVFLVAPGCPPDASPAALHFDAAALLSLLAQARQDLPLKALVVCGPARATVVVPRPELEPGAEPYCSLEISGRSAPFAETAPPLAAAAVQELLQAAQRTVRDWSTGVVAVFHTQEPASTLWDRWQRARQESRPSHPLQRRHEPLPTLPGLLPLHEQVAGLSGAAQCRETPADGFAAYGWSSLAALAREALLHPGSRQNLKRATLQKHVRDSLPPKHRGNLPAHVAAVNKLLDQLLGRLEDVGLPPGPADGCDPRMLEAACLAALEPLPLQGVDYSLLEVAMQWVAFAFAGKQPGAAARMKTAGRRAALEQMKARAP